MRAWLNQYGYRWLRAGFLALAALTLVQHAAGLALYYRDLVGGCLQTGCYFDPIVTPTAAEVAALGLTVPAYSLVLVVIEVANALVFYGVAALLYWRAPGNRVAFLGAVCLFTMGATYTVPLFALANAVPSFHWPVALLSIVSNVTLYAFLVVFPTGRFVPRYTLHLWVTFSVLVVLFEVAPDDAEMSRNLWLLIGTIVALCALILSPAVAQIYRFRKVSTPSERDQTKWVVFGVSVSLLLLLAVILYGALADPQPRAAWGLLYHLLYYGSVLLIPLALLGAILLSRLWSIDVLIRRTLIYGALTAALVALYLVAVVLLQALVVVVTGERRSTLVTVLSTLAIAALFSPLRAWLQRAVDRRFYRSRYSVGQTLAAFAASVRDDVELDGLVARLLHVVEETMQPEHVSLWLPPEAEGRHAAEKPRPVT